MRTIQFTGGPLDGTTSKVGRMPNDTYDYVERHGTEVKVHRYKCQPDNGGFTCRFVATLG